MATPSTMSVRYYLLADDGTWRLSNSAFQRLLSRVGALPQYAGTKQKIIEVEIYNVRGRKLVGEARGSFALFDGQGHLNISSQSEIISIEIDGLGSRNRKDNIVDMRPALRLRQWKAENIWQPPESILKQIRSDLLEEGSRRSPGIRSLKIQITNN